MCIQISMLQIKLYIPVCKISADVCSKCPTPERFLKPISIQVKLSFTLLPMSKPGHQLVNQQCKLLGMIPACIYQQKLVSYQHGHQLIRDQCQTNWQDLMSYCYEPIMLLIHLKRSSNEQLVLRGSLQTQIVDNVQRSSGLQNMVIHNIYYISISAVKTVTDVQL